MKLDGGKDLRENVIENIVKLKINERERGIHCSLTL